MKNVLVVMVMVIIVGLANAQPPQGKQGHQGPPPAPYFEELQKELNLTNDQLKALETLHAKFEKEREAMKQHMDTGKAQREKMHETRKAEMAKILTKEQLAKMEAMHQQKRSQKGERGKKQCGDEK